MPALGAKLAKSETKLTQFGHMLTKFGHGHFAKVARMWPTSGQIWRSPEYGPKLARFGPRLVKVGTTSMQLSHISAKQGKIGCGDGDGAQAACGRRTSARIAHQSGPQLTRSGQHRQFGPNSSKLRPSSTTCGQIRANVDPNRVDFGRVPPDLVEPGTNSADRIKSWPKFKTASPARWPRG